MSRDEEFSDSEDEAEGGGGRRHRETFKSKRIKLEEKADSKHPEEKGIIIVLMRHY